MWMYSERKFGFLACPSKYLSNILPEVVEITRSHKQEMTLIIAGLLPPSDKRELDAQAIALAVDGAIIRAQFEQTPDAVHMEPDRCIESQFTFTRSRISLPGRKWGTYLAGTITALPVLGFRPLRGGRWFRLKLPNPRISALPPLTSACDIPSIIMLTASSMSLRVS
jgi:hypothetical protein